MSGSLLESVVTELGVPLEEALRMSSLHPAEFLGLARTHGRLAPGTRADMIWLDDRLDLAGVWIGGIETPPARP